MRTDPLHKMISEIRAYIGFVAQTWSRSMSGQMAGNRVWPSNPCPCGHVEKIVKLTQAKRLAEESGGTGVPSESDASAIQVDDLVDVCEGRSRACKAPCSAHG